MRTRIFTAVVICSLAIIYLDHRAHFPSHVFATALQVPRVLPAACARPLVFEPNRGQTEKQVDFLAHSPSYNLFLSHGEAVVALSHAGQPTTAVAMRLVGTNASAQANGLDQQQSRSNYFVGNKPELWHTGIPNFERVRYANVYRGIDMVYYGNQRTLEYDFVVNQGADPSAILLDFKSPSKAIVDESGDFVMHTPSGDLRWQKPVAYQFVGGKRIPVECSYAPKGSNLLGFNIVSYDHSKPLIIDPELVYSTYLGGNVESGVGDSASSVAVDRDGDAFVAGVTGSSNFPTKNAFQSTTVISGNLPGVTNAFISEFDPAGNLVFSTYLGGSGNAAEFAGDGASGIALDERGHIYVAGSTVSSDFPVKNAFQDTLKAQPSFSAANAFVTKFNREGNELIYSTYFGGSVSDGASGIAVDDRENVYIAGVTSSLDLPLKRAFQSTPGASSPFTRLVTGFVTKFHHDGQSLVFSTYLGGSVEDTISGIAVDVRHHAYVTGFTQSTDFPVKNPFQATNNSLNGSAFVTKFNVDGDSLVYSTYLGGSGVGVVDAVSNSAAAIAVDQDEHAYVTGETTASDFPTKNAFQTEYKGGQFENPNAFVTKFDRDGGSLVYSTYLGGSGATVSGSFSNGDAAWAIAVDAHGHVYVAGSTFSADFPIKDAFQQQKNSPNGGRNAFVTKLDPSGSALIYSSYLGGSSGDIALAVAVDSRGRAVLGGNTSSNDFPVKNAFQPVPPFLNPESAFVTKISAE
jgi:Beta-propeller repeat